MTIQCKHCQAEKPESAMKMRAGKPSKVCIECDDKAKAERERLRKIVDEERSGKRSRGVRRAKKKKRAVAAPEPESSEIQPLEVLPGLGFKAFLTEDDRLQISQKNDGAPDDNIVLSKTEFKVLTAQFADWRDAPES